MLMLEIISVGWSVKRITYLLTKVYVNTKNKLLSAQFRHTASSSQTEEEGRGGREPVGEM